MYLRRQKLMGNKYLLPVISFYNNRVCISSNYFHLQRVKLHKTLTKRKKIKSVIKSNCSQSCVRWSCTKKNSVSMECSFLSTLPSQLPLSPTYSLGQVHWKMPFPSKFFIFLESLWVALILQKSAAAFAVQNKISRINSFFFLSFFCFLSFINHSV